jgi:hypothetical protein
MPSDFNQKQPTKNERMFYEMIQQLDVLDRRVWTTSSFVSALGILTKADPEKIAELLTTGQEQIKEYSKKINDAIDKIEERERAKAPHDHPSHDHAGHDHSHDHPHPHGDGGEAKPPKSEDTPAAQA